MRFLSLIFTLVILYVSLSFGAYIQPKKITWTNSVAPDVAFHRVYLVQENDTIDPINTIHSDVMMPVNEYNLPGSFNIDFLPTEGGNVKVGVAAVDNSGNISDVLEGIYFLDLQAPVIPSALEIVNQ